jgi:hypothetical protein
LPSKTQKTKKTLISLVGFSSSQVRKQDDPEKPDAIAGLAVYCVFEAALETSYYHSCGIACFFLSKGSSPGQNHFVYLANAFLHDILGVSDWGTALAEIVPFNGNYFVFYPPSCIVFKEFIPVDRCIFQK